VNSVIAGSFACLRGWHGLSCAKTMLVAKPQMRIASQVLFTDFVSRNEKPPNDGLQLRRAISIQANGKRLLKKHAVAPSAARLCWAAFAAMINVANYLFRLPESTSIDCFSKRSSTCRCLPHFVSPQQSASCCLYETVTGPLLGNVARGPTGVRV